MGVLIKSGKNQVPWISEFEKKNQTEIVKLINEIQKKNKYDLF